MNENLTPKQLKALETYVLTGNATEAATAGSISRQRFYAWLKLPAFVAELRRLDGDALQNLGRRVLGLSEAAGKALEDALNADQPIGVRLRAADMVTQRAAALAELTQIVQRLEALEANARQT
jgi:hypothetical protein